MKNLKIYSIVLLFFAAFTFVACEGDSDELTGSASVGGLLTSATPAITYALGSSPTAEQTATVSLFQGAVKTASIQVYKQFTDAAGLKSANVLYKTLTFPLTSQVETVNFTFSYAELIAGLSVNGVALPASDSTLGVGSYWKLTYLSKTSEGNEHLNVKSTKITAACVSDLGGTYNVVTNRLDFARTYTIAGEVITDLGNATYETSTTGNCKILTTTQVVGGNVWNTNPGERGGYVFSEVCGKLLVADQILHNTYSGNPVTQSAAQANLSLVDPVTGVMTIYYSLFLGDVVREYRSVYTPI
jgi:hypothetical protein